MGSGYPSDPNTKAWLEQASTPIPQQQQQQQAGLTQSATHNGCCSVPGSTCVLCARAQNCDEFWGPPTITRYSWAPAKKLMLANCCEVVSALMLVAAQALPLLPSFHDVSIFGARISAAA